MNIAPMFDLILVKIDNTQTEGLPTSGVVVAAGKGKFVDNETFVPVTLRVGLKVFLKVVSEQATKMVIEDSVHWLVRETDVLAVNRD